MRMPVVRIVLWSGRLRTSKALRIVNKIGNVCPSVLQPFEMRLCSSSELLLLCFCSVEQTGIHLYVCAIAAKLTFKEPDRVKYPCIDLAYAAGRLGGSMTAAMNAANERANEIFRQETISVNFCSLL